MFGVRLWKIFVSLGVPGLALGIFYMLFRRFKWEFPKVPKKFVGPIIILFMLLTSAIIFAALYFWAPSTKGPDIKPTHLGYLKNLQTFFQNPRNPQQFTLLLKGKEEHIKYFYIQRITADTWTDVIERICEIYSTCLKCQPEPGKIKNYVSIEILGDKLIEGLTDDGVKKYSCM